ncbi:hypothetical protein G0U57_015215, partial [Chelydra serpentina]
SVRLSLCQAVPVQALVGLSVCPGSQAVRVSWVLCLGPPARGWERRQHVCGWAEEAVLQSEPG